MKDGRQGNMNLTYIETLDAAENLRDWRAEGKQYVARNYNQPRSVAD